LAILVLEAEALTRDWLTTQLREMAARVDAAATYTEATALCLRNAYDGIVVDLLMSDLRVGAALRDLRQTPLNHQVPLFALTASANDQFSLGFPLADLLSKPINESALLSSFQHTLPVPDQRAVLVVDDDENALRMVEPMLKRLGYRPVCATSARDGLRIARADPPALIVLDLLMPDLDGFEFISCLREQPDARSIPIVIWTAKDLSHEETRRLRESASAVITKGSTSTVGLMDQLRPFLARGTLRMTP
jgi:CheY-like chemotaxis protein